MDQIYMVLKPLERSYACAWADSTPPMSRNECNAFNASHAHSLSFCSHYTMHALRINFPFFSEFLSNSCPFMVHYRLLLTIFTVVSFSRKFLFCISNARCTLLPNMRCLIYRQIYFGDFFFFFYSHYFGQNHLHAFFIGLTEMKRMNECTIWYDINSKRVELSIVDRAVHRSDTKFF